MATTSQETIKAPAPRSRRRKKFAKIGKDVYYETPEEKYAAEQDSASRSFVDLATAILPKRPYPVKVTSTRILGKHGLCAIALYKSKDGPEDEPVQVVIPYQEFTNYTDEDLEEMRIKSKNIYLKNHLNTTVDIIPTAFERSHGEVFFLGSRVKAMKKKAWDYWFAREAGTQNFRFNEGSIISARILSVHKLGANIEIFGVESHVPIEELTYVWKEDATEFIKAGSNMLARITSLERSYSGGDDFSVSFTASIKAASKDPHETAAALIKTGDRTLGTIVKNVQYENGGGYVLVEPFDRDINVHCPYPGEYDENFPFKKGSTVEIKYQKPVFTDGRWRLFGNMKHLVKY